MKNLSNRDEKKIAVAFSYKYFFIEAYILFIDQKHCVISHPLGQKSW